MSLTEAVLIHGANETGKGIVHLGVFGLLAMCFGYSALSFVSRRERHLAVNLMVYGIGLGYEAVQIHRHWRRDV